MRRISDDGCYVVFDGTVHEGKSGYSSFDVFVYDRTTKMSKLAKFVGSFGTTMKDG